MLFGFLIFDILLFAVLPLIMLGLLWGDQKGWTTFLAGAVLCYFVFADWDSVKAVFSDSVAAGNFIKNCLMYIGAGLLFSFAKWWVLTKKSAKAFTKYLGQFNFNLDKPRTSREDAAAKWNEAYNYDNQYRKVLSVVPKAGGSGWVTKYQKFTLAEYVTSWAIYWPFYALLLVLDDLIRHLFDWFVEVFGKGFQKIADSAFSHIE